MCGDGELSVKDLIARLEKATEGSRELDGAVAILLSPSERKTSHKAGFFLALCGDQFWRDFKAPHYTTSLDAKLPGENITKVEAPHDVSFPENEKCNTMWRATCVVNESEHPGIFGYGHTEALARRHAALRASLKARESKEENHD